MDVESEQSTPDSNASPHTSGQENPAIDKLTIDTKSKIERASDTSQIQYNNRPSTCVVIIKWISTAFLGVLLLACLVLSKVSVIALSFRMNDNVTNVQPTLKPGVRPFDEMVYSSQLFVMLLIITLVPHVLSLVRSLFAGLFRKDIPWPTRKCFLLATVISLLESVGTCLFVFKISDAVGNQPYLLVLSMHSVFLVPVFTNIYDDTKKGANYTMVLIVLAVLLEVAGTGSKFYLLYSESKSIEKIVYVAVAVLCLSIAWSPLVQRNLLKTLTAPDSSPPPEGPVNNTPTSDRNVTHAGTSNSGSGTHNGSAGPSTDAAGSSVMIEMTESHGWGNTGEPGQRDGSKSSPKPLEGQTTKVTPSPWKLTIYMSSLKIVFTFGTAMILYCYVLFETKLPVGTTLSLSNFSDGWHWNDIYRSGKHYEMYYFVANMVVSVVGYIAGYIACTSCMQRGAFAIPLFLATPLSLILLAGPNSCHLYIPLDEVLDDPSVCEVSSNKLKMAVFITAVVCLCLAQIISLRWLIFQHDLIVLLKEERLFWTPMYNSVLLEQWIALTRKDEVNDDDSKETKEKRSKVFICTTMYREADNEMRQLLESIEKIRQAQKNSKHSFDAHVFFDGAIKNETPQECVLQLVSLVVSTFSVNASTCTKTLTPYGMSLSWELKNDKSHSMRFVVHLKDNAKVKNKKRWSQVMYMSYVLDFLTKGESDTNTYILTTDADVEFTPDSVEALLDLMTRDHSVGAVCARTHPLGSGPLVWYQIFEYAIGHWFQKASEHVIGSVLCSPGCFSVYQCSALKDILPIYASNVEHAFDFLTKDMGEDRWLCTLMVQSGWRIEYCAASENSTHCPEEFDEFYKQRRRWVASTLANIMLLLNEWRTVHKLNHRVSLVFLIYQSILLFATLIGPSSVMLVVEGGLVYGCGVNPISTIIVQVLVTIVLTLICLFCSSKTQLAACKVVTFAYSIVMTATIVGTAVQIIQSPGIEISETMNISITTIYLGAMAGLFVLTGILHLGEFVYLLHGVWFLLCLPSGYLVLIVYSICNITDRSWGTREVQAKSVVFRGRSWQDTLAYYFRQIFLRQASEIPDQLECSCRGRNQLECSCRGRDQLHVECSCRGCTQSQASDKRRDHVTNVNDEQDGRAHDGTAQERSNNCFDNQSKSLDSSYGDSPSRQESAEKENGAAGTDINHESNDKDKKIPEDVKEWLPEDMRDNARKFEEAGFDNTMFIAGMTEKELKGIGIKEKGVIQKMVEEIKGLPDFEIVLGVPDKVHKWLEDIGLGEYKTNFDKQQIKKPQDMGILKSFGRNELEKELKITKPGHIKRLLYAIGRLRNPTERERNLEEVRKAIEKTPTTGNDEENAFWDKLRNKCLLPQSTASGSEADLKHKLGHLRNAWLMVFAVSNTLWLFLIETLASRGELLDTFGSNPVGLVVLVLFSVVMVIQFCAMLVHRVGTLIHYLARAPYKVGALYKSSFTFNDDDENQTQNDGNGLKAHGNTNKPAGELSEETDKNTTRRPKREEKQPLTQYVEEVHNIDVGDQT